MGREGGCLQRAFSSASLLCHNFSPPAEPPSLSPSPTPSHTNKHIITHMQTISHFLRHIRNLHFVRALVQESNICNLSDSSVTNPVSYSLLIRGALRSLLSHIPSFSGASLTSCTLLISLHRNTFVCCLFFSKMRPPTCADKLHWFMAFLTLLEFSCLCDYLIWKALWAHLCYLCPFYLLHSRWESFHIKESGTEDGCCSKPTWEKDFWSGAYM